MEEFGITAVEAQAAGRPVIAAASGGALETVIEGRTGSFARLDDVESFARAIEGLDALGLDPRDAVENAAQFSVAEFQRRLTAHVAQTLADDARQKPR
jgi:glycosyltransferase involved in cell wall biosynthesis